MRVGSWGRGRWLAWMLLGGTAACGAATPVRSTTSGGENSAETTAAEDARSVVAALDDIRGASVCIAPDVCEDLSRWAPTALVVLDGHLVALDATHAFVRVDGAWVHHAIQRRSAVATNGRAAFFCDGDGGVHELTADGVRRRGTLEARACAFVAAAGDELYVVEGSGPVFHQVGDGWERLAFELPYGNGYSTDTVAMGPRRAFALDRECNVLELPAEGPSFEPRVVARTGLSGSCTMQAAVGTDRLIAQSAEGLVIVEDEQVRSVGMPPIAAPGAPGSGNDERDENEEPRESESATSELVATVVGTDPLVVMRATLHYARGITIDHFMLEAAGWTELARATPESYRAELSAGGIGTDMPTIERPVVLGDLRIAALSYSSAGRGPRVRAWPLRGADPVLTAFPDSSAADEAALADRLRRCGGRADGCIPQPSGPYVHLTHVRASRGERGSFAIDVLGPDGTPTLHHEGAVDLTAFDAPSVDRLLVVAGGVASLVDATGARAIRLPSGVRPRSGRATAAGHAYIDLDPPGLAYFDGTRARVLPATVPLGAPRNWRVIDDGFVSLSPEAGLVWIHDGTLAQLQLGDGTTPAEPPDDVVPTCGGVSAIRDDGTTWMIRGGELFVASAPPVDEAHAAGPVFLVPSCDADGTERWLVAFNPSGTPGYRTSAPDLRSLGTLASRSTPLASPAR